MMPKFYVVGFKYRGSLTGVDEVLVTAETSREAIAQVIDSPVTKEMGYDLKEVFAHDIETLSSREEELADLHAQESQEDDDAEAGA